MRKHFLLLMMTLLSVTAYAETDISSDPKVSMSTGNVVFGDGVAPAIQLLYDGYKMTIDDGNALNGPEDYIWDGKYYTTSACTAEAGAIDELEVGTYFVKVVGEGVYTGTRVASFDVTKRPVEVNLNAPLSKTYGAADPALTDDNINWLGAVGFKAPDDKTVFTGTLSYTYDNGNVGLHTISVTGLNAKNYTLKVNGGLTINPKEIVAGMITPVTLSETYTGATFTEFAVNIKDGSKPLVAGTDFNLGVYTTEAVDVPVVPGQPKNVITAPGGKYYLGISQKDGANYSLAATTLVGTFEITKAGLTVRALNQTKVYDGNKNLPSTKLGEAYEFIGVQGGDVFTGLTVALDAEDNKNVGDHTIIPSAIVGKAASKYTAESAKAYNAKLPGAVKAGDIQTPAVYTQVATIGALTDGETYYTSADGDGEFVSDGSEMSDGTNYWTKTADAILYTAETAAGANAGLAGAVDTSKDDPITATLATDYDINYVEGTLSITKRTLTITANDAKKVYKKAETTVTKMDGSAKDATIGYGGVTFTPTLAPGEVAWNVPAADQEAMAAEYNKGAGDAAAKAYRGTLRITRTGAGEAAKELKGDYKDDLVLSKNDAGGVWDNYTVTLKPGTFHITGGKLYITALHQSKNYGEADPSWTANDATSDGEGNYIVTGLSDPDVVSGVTLSCTHDEAVGTYTINIDATGVPAGYEEIVFVPAKFTINKRPISIVANPQTLKIGDTPANLDQNAYTITSKAAGEGLMDGDEASDVFSLTTANALDVAGIFADAITMVDGAKIGNYDVDFDEGLLIVVDPASYIVLNRPNKAAFTADPTLDNAADVIAAGADATYTAAQAGSANTFLDGALHYNDVKTPAAVYTASEAIAFNATLPGKKDVGDDKVYTAETAAEYNLTLDGAIAAGTALTAAQVALVNGVIATSYVEGDKISVADATAYNATLAGKVAAGDVLCYTAAEAVDFNAHLGDAISTATVLDATQATTLNGLVGVSRTDYAAGENPTAEDAILFNANLGGAVAAGDPTGVKYTAEEAMDYNAALDGAVAAGDAKGLPTLYTNDEVDAFNAALPGAVAEGDAKNMSVTFGDFAMVAEKWYPIVLPFETSVREVSETFGYAIVNILNEQNTDKTKIAFKLHMGDIPANKPFVVKVYEDMNMNEVAFLDKAIVKGASLVATDESGVKFIGSYNAKTDGFRANEAFFSVSAAKNDYYWGSDKNTTYMAPLSAYFQVPANSSARTIVFEEPDGSTTAIEAVSNANVANSNDAIYNLAGQKVGADYKGIVIKNGKRFVQK